VLGSIIWDICVTKPAIRESIEDIRVEVKDIHKKLNTKFASDTISFYDAYMKVQQDRSLAKKDSISK
jgi:signal transduction protein with GAF and PtsI domain